MIQALEDLSNKYIREVEEGERLECKLAWLENRKQKRAEKEIARNKVNNAVDEAL